MMINNAKVNSEVYGVLNAVDEEYIRKVPKKMIDLIIKNKDNSMNFEYDLKKRLNEQNISREALSMIALIHLNYWCENEQEKAELNRIFKENAIKNEEERRLKYSPDNIFKNKKEVVHKEEASQNMQMVEYKENVFKRIINFIKSIFVKK